MQWSKLKSRVRDLICEDLADRIDFHLTSYRHSHDGADKVWITVDGERVFNCKYYSYVWAESLAYHIGLGPDEVKTNLRQNEIHNPRDFGDSIREYLSMPIGKAIDSSNPIIKAFAIIDRRTGKRALGRIKELGLDHSLVNIFYSLRIGETKKV